MLSLYVHIPFCVGKCHYCGFYSTRYSPDLADRFLEALELDLSRYRESFGSHQVGSVYIGGGTPSVLSPSQLRKALSSIRSFRLAPGAEWTIEANPGSLAEHHLREARDAGVNRASLGVQSFADEVLQFLGRPHSVKDAVDAFRMVRKAGFRNIGIDLIYGIPGQSIGHWNEALSRAVALGPEHISTYGLSMDEGSRFSALARSGEFRPSGDEAAARQYERAQEVLTQAGYEQYEISNFSLPGFSCRHNENYWARGEYLGLGPGAWSCFQDHRYQIVPDVQEYCGRVERGESVIEQEDIVSIEQAADETLMLSLRTAAGLDLMDYEKRFGTAVSDQLRSRASRCNGKGLVELTDERLRLTAKGFLLSNSILGNLLR